ncbi:MAG: ribonuclease P protein component [Planctomycetes bacterium]|nr:ribonuclease P protein component [Planctomycetota bacterium]
MQNFPRDERLCARKAVARLFNQGAGAGAGKVVVRALANGGGNNRVAVVAGKSLGGAVKRNRLRRRLRAAYRLQKANLPNGWDLVFLARPGLSEVKWPEVVRNLAEAVRRVVREASGPRRPPPLG